MPTSTPLVADALDLHVPVEGALLPDQAVEAYRRALRRGDDWYDTLLAIVARWVAPFEILEGMEHVYLVGGEAFDWLRLAQRLIDAAGDLVPLAETERLLIMGLPPRTETEEDFEHAIGPAKYRAHLNFQYGVVIEELLMLSTEQELLKAGGLTHYGRRNADIAAYEHVYGKPLEELKLLYLQEGGTDVSEEVDLSAMHAFTYWLSKYRLRAMEPARVASDTKKAMQMMARLEGNRARADRAAQAKRRASSISG